MKPGKTNAMNLASNLRLSIDLNVQGDDQWIEVKLEDDLSLSEAKITYPVRCYTTDRSYHLIESLVISMRKVIHAGLDKGLILDCPGELAIWKPQHASAAPMLSTLLDEDVFQLSPEQESQLRSFVTTELPKL
jgi:hypothetical protein